MSNEIPISTFNINVNTKIGHLLFFSSQHDMRCLHSKSKYQRLLISPLIALDATVARLLKEFIHFQTFPNALELFIYTFH